VNGYCPHPEVVPVEVRFIEGVETVAAICAVCFDRVPVNFGCDYCRTGKIMAPDRPYPVGAYTIAYCEIHHAEV
jgi:hypothetical protein